MKEEKEWDLMRQDRDMLLKQVEIAEGALKEIESGNECSACSCNCHRVASNALIEAEKVIPSGEQ